MTPSDKAEAERRYPDLRYDLTYPPDAISAASRAAYIAGREDERAARLRAPGTPAPIEPGEAQGNIEHALQLAVDAYENDGGDRITAVAAAVEAYIRALPKPAPATADTVHVSREIRTILEVARLGLHHSNTALRAEIDRLLAEGAR